MIPNLEMFSQNVETRRQCGIPLDETDTTTIVCPEEASGEIQIPLDDGSFVDMPICAGHLEFLVENFNKKLDTN